MPQVTGFLGWSYFLPSYLGGRGTTSVGKFLSPELFYFKSKQGRPSFRITLSLPPSLPLYRTFQSAPAAHSEDFTQAALGLAQRYVN